MEDRREEMLQYDVHKIVKRIMEISYTGQGKHFLITGATGMIGNYFLQTLLELNKTIWREEPCKIICISRRLMNVEKQEHVKWVNKDISNAFDINFEFDFIIHCAADSDVAHKWCRPVEVLGSNIFGTWNILQLAKNHLTKSGVVLFVSSAAVYGEIGKKTIREDDFSSCFLDSFISSNCYAESKRVGENMCAAYAREFHLPVRVVRPYLIYASNMNYERQELVPSIFHAVQKGETIVIKSDGKAVRNFCYIEDCIVGFFYVLFCGDNGEIYQIADDNGSVTVKEFTEKVIWTLDSRGIQRDMVILCPDDGSDVKYYCPDLSRLKAIGYSARISLDEGISRCISALGI